MGLLNKIQDNDKGLDITIFGTALTLVFFISFCAMFDLWILTFAKENVSSKLESYSFAALAKNVDYTNPAYIQAVQDGNLNSVINGTNITRQIEEDFKAYFNTGIGTSSGFIKNVKFSPQGTTNVVPTHCFVGDGGSLGSKSAIYLQSGTVEFSVKKLLRAGNKVPFIGGNTKSYESERVYTATKCLVRFVFNKQFY